ncbi:MAG: hypothetical protein UEP57_03870 [Oscillospiraceae bacterium]|nr:hypothetical protein [Oscillospiraceae bacterium]
MYGLEEEDYYDVVVFGYLNAVYDYHTDPDLGKYHFSTVCWQSMRGSLSNHRKTQQRLKRKGFFVVPALRCDIG